MATAKEFARWIVDNQNLAGTPDFDTVVMGFERAKQFIVQ